jgi:hypothetical protein
MKQKNISTGNTRKYKVLVGAVAIVLLLFFTALGITGEFSVWEWLIADLIVAVLANLALKLINRKSQ